MNFKLLTLFYLFSWEHNLLGGGLGHVFEINLTHLTLAHCNILLYDLSKPRSVQKL